MTTTELTIYRPNLSLKEMKDAGDILFKSGLFRDVGTAAQAIVKVMAGQEIGIAPFAAMSGIYIVQGKAVLGYVILAAKIKNDPRYNYKVVRHTDDECVIDFYEGGEVCGQASYTIAEAQAAGLMSKDNWRKARKDMLFARALTRGARWFCAGIFSGVSVYTPEEMGVDTDEDGVIIDATPLPATVPAQATTDFDELSAREKAIVSLDPRSPADLRNTLFKTIAAHHNNIETPRQGAEILRNLGFSGERDLVMGRPDHWLFMARAAWLYPDLLEEGYDEEEALIMTADAMEIDLPDPESE